MMRKLLDMWRRSLWWLIYLLPRRDVTIPTANGVLTVCNKDWLIGKHLYVKRAHEIHEIHEALDLLQGGTRRGNKDTVLNVGSNIGMTCIALLKHNYFYKAIAVEPSPSTYRLLVRNVHQNGFKNRVVTLPYALSSSSGEADLELSEDNSGDNRIRRAQTPGFFQEGKRRTIRVPARTLDQVFLEQPALIPESIGLVWVDIQGHEGHFLQGATRFFKQRTPVVSEFWPYGILRSAMSQAEFCQTVSELFTHFHVLSGKVSGKRPIGSIESLFSDYSKPREMCLVAFVHD